MSSFDLNLARVFVLLYETGSVTATAETLHVTQPTVSHSLACCAATSTTTSSRRTGRGLTPTAGARRLYEPPATRAGRHRRSDPPGRRLRPRDHGGPFHPRPVRPSARSRSCRAWWRRPASARPGCPSPSARWTWTTPRASCAAANSTRSSPPRHDLPPHRAHPALPRALRRHGRRRPPAHPRPVRHPGRAGGRAPRHGLRPQRPCRPPVRAFAAHGLLDRVAVDATRSMLPPTCWNAPT
ncbi:LysR family transcriptional regulator [Streptomyces tricolor]|nr:LysR family transcriptional regulator [Streptomyces tricolor]